MNLSSSSSVSRAVQGTLLLAAAVLAVPAMRAATPVDPSATTASIFHVDPSMLSADTLRYETAGVSSSTEDAIADEREELSGSGLGAGAGTAPTGRRRSYGRSRYEDRMHNADGSTKVAFVAGAGLNVPVANTGKFYTPSYDIVVGAGYNFSKMFGVLGEFHYDHMGVTGGAIAEEYAALVAYGATSDDLAGFDANAHVYSITVDPVVNFASDRSRFGAYFTGGVGYYHKTTNFTLPTYGTACDYFCYTYATQYNVDQASAGGFGVNGGIGLTYKISEFSNERLFVEGRYNWIKISSSNNQDFFPYNRRNTEYIPVVAGIRF
jgi:hypothetical protein